MSKDGNAIEANPATHRIAEHVCRLLEEFHSEWHTTQPQPLQEDGVEEILFQYINSPEYYTDGNKQAFKRGFEYCKQLNK